MFLLYHPRRYLLLMAKCRIMSDLKQHSYQPMEATEMSEEYSEWRLY